MKRFLVLATIFTLLVSAINVNTTCSQATDEKILIAYFTRSENSEGDTSDIDATTSASLLSNGNAAIIADYIKEVTNGDIFSILVENPYPADYDACLERAQRENADNERPSLKSLPENIDSYDTIFIGYPDWCGTCPMAVFTFLESIDTRGKKVIPFCAHGTSGLGTSTDDIKSVCSDATIEDAFGVYRDNVSSCEDGVIKWLSTLGYSSDVSTANSAEMELTNDTVTIKASEEIKNAILILAGYNGDVLCGIDIRKVSTDSKLEIKESISGFTDADTIKAFLWTSFGEIQPLCASKEISPQSGDKYLTVYFSRMRNTDYPSDIDATTSASVVVNNSGRLTGTTEAVANMIHSAVGGDIAEIQTVNKYTADFDELVDVNHDEANRNYLPEIQPLNIDISEYDTIFLGFPIWATDVPQAVRTFLKSHDLSGKTILPFCTHDGYGAGSSYSSVKSECPNSTVLDGLTIPAKEIVGTDLSAVNTKVSDWLTKNGIELDGAESDGKTSIKITIGNIVLDGYLNNTPEAEQFKAMLPVTVSMYGYGGREYYGGIDGTIDDSTDGKLNFENGDITYCPINNTVAIFYAQTSRPNLTMKVISMGKVTSDLSVFDTLADTENITFDLA